MVDERELLDLAKADGIPERLAERIIDQLVSQEEIYRDGRHYRAGANGPAGPLTYGTASRKDAGVTSWSFLRRGLP
jgi:hypothetical protein